MLKAWSIALVVACSLNGVTANSADKPNVIIILTDDQGTVDAGCYGSSDLSTPHIDALAERGVRFTSVLCCGTGLLSVACWAAHGPLSGSGVCSRKRQFDGGTSGDAHLAGDDRRDLQGRRIRDRTYRKVAPGLQH